MASGLVDGLFQSFINYLYSTGDINVPSDFHDRCTKITTMLDNDISGIVSTIIGYAINSASEAIFKIECSDESLENLLNLWLSRINLNVNGVPTGLQELSKEYLKERWAGSSLCLMRVNNWEKISIGQNSITVPTVLYFVNGASIYIDRKNRKNFKLGSDKYFLDEKKELSLPKNDKEQIIVQKPFARWHTEYPSPYLIKTGILKNWLAMEILASKGDEVISKVLPYLFTITKGDVQAFLQKDVDYGDPELKTLLDNFKAGVERYKNEKGKLPANAIPFDQKYEHLIPDLLPILKEELYRQGYRAIMAGLGFADMLEITPSRQETRLNPKPFIAEINAAVADFKSMLMDVIRLIISENKIEHRKLFSDNKTLKIVNTQLRINIDQILDQIRSGYDRGILSYQSYIESLRFDYTTEKERRIKEGLSNEQEIFYPRIITNQEEKGIDIVTKKPKTNKQENLEDEDKKPGSPESKNFKKAESKIKEIAKCKKCGHEFDYLSVPEAGMGYVKCPNCEEAVTQDDVIIAPYDKDNPPNFLKKYPKEARDAFIETFNKLLKDGKPEEYCFPVAWNQLKRVLKKLKEKK